MDNWNNRRLHRQPDIPIRLKIYFNHEIKEYDVKGLEFSMTLILALMMGVIVIVILASILSGNISGLEEFGASNIELPGGGD